MRDQALGDVLLGSLLVFQNLHQSWRDNGLPGLGRHHGAGALAQALVEFLKAQKVALQYIPERLVVRDDLPSTPSGKIQKFRLREMMRNSAL